MGPLLGVAGKGAQRGPSGERTGVSGGVELHTLLIGSHASRLARTLFKPTTYYIFPPHTITVACGEACAFNVRRTRNRKTAPLPR